MNMHHIKFVVLAFIVSMAIPSTQAVKSFASADECLIYYAEAPACKEVQGMELTKEDLERVYHLSVSRLLNGVKANYSQEDYKAISNFFHVYLARWNKKDSVLLYPCHADKVYVNGQLVWVVSFDWEVPVYSRKEKVVLLAHIMVLLIDPKTGEVIGSSSCG